LCLSDGLRVEGVGGGRGHRFAKSVLRAEEQKGAEFVGNSRKR